MDYIKVSKYISLILRHSPETIGIALDELSNAKYRNPFELDKYVREITADKNKRFYVFIDEVQLVLEMQNPYVEGVEDKIGFVPVLLGLMKLKNVDLYVTGSNSKINFLRSTETLFHKMHSVALCQSIDCGESHVMARTAIL